MGGGFKDGRWGWVGQGDRLVENGDNYIWTTIKVIIIIKLKERYRTLVNHKGAPIRLSFESKEISITCSKWWKARTYNQDYFTQQDYYLELKVKFKRKKKEQKEFITTKPLSLSHIHTSVRESSLRRKKKEREKDREGEGRKEVIKNKMAVNAYLSKSH